MDTLMDRVTFNTLLVEAEISKEEFAKKVNLKYTSVNNWGSSQNVPHWVESWMLLYIENQKCMKLKKAIKESGACDSDLI
jgi:hypothetical protein